VEVGVVDEEQGPAYMWPVRGGLHGAPDVDGTELAGSTAAVVSPWQSSEPWSSPSRPPRPVLPGWWRHGKVNCGGARRSTHGG
jgi:hypothetical protein